jgi:predicted polyphosphate/ATP-dependent NAD kinase
MKRSIKSPQRLVRMLSAELTGTGTAALGGTCANQMSLTDNGTGDYSVAFDAAFEQMPEVVVTPQTADTIVQVANKAKTGFDVLCFDAGDGTTAKDAVVDIMVIGSDALDLV